VQSGSSAQPSGRPAICLWRFTAEVGFAASVVRGHGADQSKASALAGRGRELTLMGFGLPRMDKAVLLAPAAIAGAAARGARRPEERWLLKQPRPVRTSYVQQVLDASDERNAEEVWMLRQTRAVRESYIREVLRP